MAPKRGRHYHEQKYRKLKLFKPEYRTPFKFNVLMKGRRSPWVAEPEGWLIAAIESGLVEMGSVGKDGRIRDMVEPLKGGSIPEYDGPPLEDLWIQGTADALAKLTAAKPTVTKPTAKPKGVKDK